MQSTVIDRDGYRPNVGIILANSAAKVLWARRIGQNSWQFPQGGIKRHESPEDALYRELDEELGLQPEHVRVVGCTQDWLRYNLPRRFLRRNCRPLCIGQKQIWFLLLFLAGETAVKLDKCAKPEFDCWKWVNYWHPSREVIFFKRSVYRRALSELAPLMFSMQEAFLGGSERVGKGPRPTGGFPVSPGKSEASGGRIPRSGI